MSLSKSIFILQVNIGLMELHVVNVKENEGDTPDYLVISFLFKVGAENKFISRFIKDIPDSSEDTKEVELNVLKE